MNNPLTQEHLDRVRDYLARMGYDPDMVGTKPDGRTRRELADELREKLREG